MSFLSGLTYDSLTSSTSSSGSSTSSTTTSDDSTYETYMTLLLTTLQNQDPTDPEDVSDITDQLATFEQLELAEQNNALLSNLSESLTALQGLSMTVRHRPISEPTLLPLAIPPRSRMAKPNGTTSLKMTPKVSRSP